MLGRGIRCGRHAGFERSCQRCKHAKCSAQTVVARRWGTWGSTAAHAAAESTAPELAAQADGAPAEEPQELQASEAPAPVQPSNSPAQHQAPRKEPRRKQGKRLGGRQHASNTHFSGTDHVSRIPDVVPPSDWSAWVQALCGNWKAGNEDFINCAHGLRRVDAKVLRTDVSHALRVFESVTQLVHVARNKSSAIALDAPRFLSALGKAIAQHPSVQAQMQRTRALDGDARALFKRCARDEEVFVDSRALGMAASAQAQLGVASGPFWERVKDESRPLAPNAVAATLLLRSYATLTAQKFVTIRDQELLARLTALVAERADELSKQDLVLALSAFSTLNLRFASGKAAARDAAADDAAALADARPGTQQQQRAALRQAVCRTAPGMNTLSVAGVLCSLRRLPELVGAEASEALLAGLAACGGHMQVYELQRALGALAHVNMRPRLALDAAADDRVAKAFAEAGRRGTTGEVAKLMQSGAQVSTVKNSQLHHAMARAAQRLLPHMSARDTVTTLQALAQLPAAFHGVQRDQRYAHGLAVRDAAAAAFVRTSRQIDSRMLVTALAALAKREFSAAQDSQLSAAISDATARLARDMPAHALAQVTTSLGRCNVVLDATARDAVSASVLRTVNRLDARQLHSTLQALNALQVGAGGAVRSEGLNKAERDTLLPAVARMAPRMNSAAVASTWEALAALEPPVDEDAARAMLSAAQRVAGDMAPGEAVRTLIAVSAVAPGADAKAQSALVDALQSGAPNTPPRLVAPTLRALAALEVPVQGDLRTGLLSAAAPALATLSAEHNASLLSALSSMSSSLSSELASAVCNAVDRVAKDLSPDDTCTAVQALDAMGFKRAWSSDNLHAAIVRHREQLGAEEVVAVAAALARLQGKVGRDVRAALFGAATRVASQLTPPQLAQALLAFAELLEPLSGAVRRALFGALEACASELAPRDAVSAVAALAWLSAKDMPLDAVDVPAVFRRLKADALTPTDKKQVQSCTSCTRHNEVIVTSKHTLTVLLTASCLVELHSILAQRRKLARHRCCFRLCIRDRVSDTLQVAVSAAVLQPLLPEPDDCASLLEACHGAVAEAAQAPPTRMQSILRDVLERLVGSSPDASLAFEVCDLHAPHAVPRCSRAHCIQGVCTWPELFI
jgi:hypothetical protein